MCYKQIEPTIPRTYWCCYDCFRQRIQKAHFSIERMIERMGTYSSHDTLRTPNNGFNKQIRSNTTVVQTLLALPTWAPCISILKMRSWLVRIWPELSWGSPQYYPNGTTYGKLRCSVCISRELLCPDRPGRPPVCRVPHTMVNNPVFAFVRTLGEASMAHAVCVLECILVEHTLHCSFASLAHSLGHL